MHAMEEVKRWGKPVGTHLQLHNKQLTNTNTNTNTNIESKTQKQQQQRTPTKPTKAISMQPPNWQVRQHQT